MAAFSMENEDDVLALTAQKCIPKIKPAYANAGRIYGYLSKFSHWEFSVHSFFLGTTGDKVGVMKATCKFRAMSLVFCLLILDVVVESVRFLYGDGSSNLVLKIQDTLERTEERNVHKFVNEVYRWSESADIAQLRFLMS